MMSVTLVTNASVSPTLANAGDRLGQRWTRTNIASRHVYDVQTGAPSAYRACLQAHKQQQRCREYIQVLSTSRTVTTRVNMSVTRKARKLRANDFSCKHVCDTKKEEFSSKRFCDVKNKSSRIYPCYAKKTRVLDKICMQYQKREFSSKHVCGIKNKNSRVNMSVASKTRILE